MRRHQTIGQRRHLVGDDHRSFQESRLECRRPACQQNEVGGHHRLMRMTKQQADRQLLRRAPMQRGFEQQARLASRQRNEKNRRRDLVVYPASGLDEGLRHVLQLGLPTTRQESEYRFLR
jgi:hypothetical protein